MVVVLESIHRHQKNGLGPTGQHSKGPTRSPYPWLASTLTTMAVLMPVLLLAGLAKKLFAPLAPDRGLVAMTGVVLRQCLRHASRVSLLSRTCRTRSIRQGSRVLHRRHCLWLLGGYCAQFCRFAGRSWVAAALITVAAVFASTRLPSTFFPEIDRVDGSEFTFASRPPFRSPTHPSSCKRWEKPWPRSYPRAMSTWYSATSAHRTTRAAHDQPEQRSRTWASFALQLVDE